jgi:hypothetical protein
LSALPFVSECPKCGQRAPIVLRGLDSRCAACGAARSLLAAPHVAFAGQPSRWGGLAASIAGTAILVLGLSSSAGVWLLLQSIWPAHWVGWAFALPLASASLLFGLPLLFGGNRLRRRGAERRLEVQLAAVRARVQHQRGPISAQQVAAELQLPEAEVDALLTRLAQEAATAVTLDVDAQGRVVYDFEGEDRRWRVLEEEAAADEQREPAVEPSKRQRR